VNTDRLIENLARDVEPVRPLRLPWIRAAWWSLAAGLYALLLALLLTSSDDVAVNATSRGFVAYQMASIAMAIAAVVAAFASVVPGYSPKIILLPAAAAAAWLALLLAGVPQEWRAVGLAGVADAHEMLCVVTIVVTAVPPAFGLALMLRNGAPLTPGLTMALGVLAAAGLTNVVTCLASPHTSGIAVLAWHGTTLVALCALAAWIGQFVLPWRVSTPHAR
jgi:hypothetical protein